MKKIIVSIVIFSFLSCLKNSNTIDLYNNVTFGMLRGEEPLEIQPTINDFYSEYFNSSEPQIPLFKYIRHSNYKIFIGIPYNTSINKLNKAQLEKPFKPGVYFRSDSNYFYTRYEKNGYYITEYATKFKEKSLIYISTMTTTKEISDSLFNIENMSKRLN